MELPTTLVALALIAIGVVVASVGTMRVARNPVRHRRAGGVQSKRAGGIACLIVGLVLAALAAANWALPDTVPLIYPVLTAVVLASALLLVNAKLDRDRGLPSPPPAQEFDTHRRPSDHQPTPQPGRDPGQVFLRGKDDR